MEIPIRSSNQIYLHSKDASREYGTDTEKNSDLRFYLDTPIRVGSQYKLEVSLVSFNSPVSWGNINEYNNTFTWNGNSITIDTGDYNIADICTTLTNHFTPLSFTFNQITSKLSIEISENYYTVPSGETFTIDGNSYTIPSGSYTSTLALRAAIESVMPANFGIHYTILSTNYNNFYIHGPNTQFTFSTNSKVFNYLGFTGFTDGQDYISSLKVVGSSNYQVIESNFDITELPQYFSGTLFETLGLTSSESIVYVSYLNTSANANTIVTGSNIFDLSGSPYVVLISNFNTRNISSHRKKRTKILAHIPVENNHYISFHGTGFKFLSDVSDVHYIDIILLDPEHNPINMRGSHFSLTLQFDYIPLN